MPPRNWMEKYLEIGLFGSRWLLAPFYAGLVIALAMLLIVFLRELASAIPGVIRLDAEQMILSVLTLIDLSLAGNLVLIVVFSGYENFVSKISAAVGSRDRPSWMGTLDFSGLKMKLIGSIVAISAISLLRAFVTLTQQGPALDTRKLGWLIALHITFLLSGVMFAIMDWVASLTEERRIAELRALANSP
ncbi:MAG: TIGR00645 family protein [Alphaproteobacteria bacterium]